MSEKQRRISDIVDNYKNNYDIAIKDYSEYTNGQTGTEIVYYQIADEATRTDATLESSNELVGANSSLRYYRIKKVLVYNVSQLDIQNQLTQRGYESLINSDFIMTPDISICPRSGEFFTFVDPSNPDFEQQLFVIDDVQYDRASSQKFYRCSFKIYPYNADTIFGAVVKTFIYDPSRKGNSYGVGDSVLIAEEDASRQSMIDELSDELIDRFTDLFYDEGMDTFVYQKALDRSGNNFEYYWNPYLCHFIYKNNIIEKTNQDFLTEIYVQDYNETDYPFIYSEEGYRGTLLYALETKNTNLLKTVESCFYEVSAFDLNKPLTLPFFSTAEKYYLVEPQHRFNQDFWMGAFNWIYDNEERKYMFIDNMYKYRGSFYNYLNNDPRNFINIADEKINDEYKDVLLGQTFYEINTNDFDIKKMYRIPDVSSSEDVEPYPCDMKSLLLPTSQYNNDLLFNIVRDYFNNTLVLTDNVISELQYFYYQNNFKTYMLLPMVIYVLRHSKG